MCTPSPAPSPGSFPRGCADSTAAAPGDRTRRAVRGGEPGARRGVRRGPAPRAPGRPRLARRDRPRPRGGDRRARRGHLPGAAEARDRMPRRERCPAPDRLRPRPLRTDHRTPRRPGRMGRQGVRAGPATGAASPRRRRPAGATICAAGSASGSPATTPGGARERSHGPCTPTCASAPKPDACTAPRAASSRASPVRTFSTPPTWCRANAARSSSRRCANAPRATRAYAWS